MSGIYFTLILFLFALNWFHSLALYTMFFRNNLVSRGRNKTEKSGLGWGYRGWDGEI